MNEGLKVACMQRPAPGQRWISTSEPGLGLGMVRAFDGRTVRIHFAAVEETRNYAYESAPLVRVSFSPGDVIVDGDHRSLTIERVSSLDGILTYHGGGRALGESALLDSQSFIRPDQRLLAGLCDGPRDFQQRLEALGWNARLRGSRARGFIGGRIDLLPHQLAIVEETAGRLRPRVLLADEVGLGKTIEACLILHRMHLTGRAARILILVPESLVHQWFVELLRRFNLLFAIFDETRCASIEAHDAGCNPFLDSQLIVAATGFMSASAQRAGQARSAGFDLLIVDEAHHLEWSPGKVSADYDMVESLATRIPSLLLLTATPQQLGVAGHFARLRLLDPERYADLTTFEAEARAYGPLAAAVECLRAGGLPASLEGFAGGSARAAAHLGSLRAGDESARAPLMAELIDCFGTGRVLFRNTRDQLRGFPERRPHLYPLPRGTSPYKWLADLLRTLPPCEKILLITATPDAAVTVQQNLRGIIEVEAALFHEDLTLIQRDRNAAWFAEADGARILICSEIGSEGRNFQFARHLVLFGLPRDPELLEQRIGRLDRIGQTGTIHIHVPYGTHSRSELHARWLHEGLDAFSRPLKGATTLAGALLAELDAIPCQAPDPARFEAFLQRSRQLKDQVARELASGHDRLLELGTPAPHRAARLIEHIEAADADRGFERFVLRLFDHLGLDISDHSQRGYHFHRGQRHSESFADLPADGLAATFERATALAREDLTFFTADHPVLLGALEHLLDSESGNACFAQWKTGEGKGVILECVFVLETMAPARLHLDRFLPPTPIRVAVDHRGAVFEGVVPSAALVAGDPRRLVRQEGFRRELYPRMCDKAHALAAAAAPALAAEARRLAAAAYGAELERLTDLATRNPQVTPADIAALSHARDETLAGLANPRLRLDALRVIWRI